ncbi:nitroreductase family deazaflavin-dependent oxidoreductase [Salinibacterium sp. NG253]|uniref:nitroreductase family deazaflavin-dependent oxidoreductase n=1 Tax=Salinibacterium sp. NG253 TaxID=2792039 RepID=UPI0018CEE8D1|nr:nitroreductase family deazaflavin-dependent oxidoreductase [Salinibacterium sp. NG253]MBH0117025.1 nitroreductase family deazaflavin-dependent oxidoreductase [Salinibacterium sp. NG253]
MAKTYRLGFVRRAANLFMTAMIKTGLGPSSNYLLSTTGRKSGELRTTPVTIIEAAGNRWLVAPYGNVSWVHNVRADNAVKLRRGRRSEVLYAERLAAHAAGPVLQQYVRNVPITAPFFDATSEDPVTKFVDEASQHPVFRLTPEASRPRSN